MRSRTTLQKFRALDPADHRDVEHRRDHERPPDRRHDGARDLAVDARNALTLGALTIASGLAIRIATMSGWIMWTSIGIFDNVGAVQEGMETIARPQDLVDKPRRAWS